MKNKILLISLALILPLVPIFTACAPAPSPAEPVKLRFFTGMTPSHYFSADLMTFFAEEVEKRTQGRVEVELYPGKELYSYLDGIDATVAGAVEMGLTAVGHWGGYNPVFQFTDYFLIIDDNDHWFRARDMVRPILEALYEEQNVKLLNYSAYGGNSIGSKVPIETLEDMKGLKIRAPVPGALASLEGWGATPAKVAAAEVYDALAKGAIDAAVTSWASFYTRKFYEVVDHFVGPIWWTVWVTFMNLDTWNSLPKDIQATIMEVSAEVEAQSLGLAKSFDEMALAELRKVGTVKILTTAEKAVWAEPLKPIYDAWLEQSAAAGYGDQAKQIIAALNKAR